MVPSPLLLSAIEIEGYAVLAVELLATRQLTPYGGNATDIVAIVIVADLLPLALYDLHERLETEGRLRVILCPSYALRERPVSRLEPTSEGTSGMRHEPTYSDLRRLLASRRLFRRREVGGAIAYLSDSCQCGCVT
jgi:hypothetical protein